MTCGISKPNVPWRTLPQGLIPSSTSVRDGSVVYPCRQARFCLQTDILPDGDGNFKFPSSGEGGFPVDLGQYKFTDDNGHSILEVQRSERRSLVISNPHTWIPSHVQAVEAGVTANARGVIVSTQEGGVSTRRQVEASLEIELKEPRKRWQRVIKPRKK